MNGLLELVQSTSAQVAVSWLCWRVAMAKSYVQLRGGAAWLYALRWCLLTWVLSPLWLWCDGWRLPSCSFEHEEVEEASLGRRGGGAGARDVAQAAVQRSD